MRRAAAFGYAGRFAPSSSRPTPPITSTRTAIRTQVSDSLKNTHEMIAIAATPTADQIAYAMPSGTPRPSASDSAKNDARYPTTTMTKAHHFGFSPEANFRNVVATTSVA